MLQALNKEGKALDETSYKHLLETEYSCLKRPILHWETTFYLGNSKKQLQPCNWPFMDKRFLAILAALGGTTIYALNHTIAKDVMPTYVQGFGFIMIRLIGGTVLL